MEIATSPSDSQSYRFDTPDGSFFVPSPVHVCGEYKLDTQSSLPCQSSEGYSGLMLERYVVHPGRFGSTEDNSLLEAVVQSAFDDFKSVRVVAEGSESIHSFMRSLSEGFLNCGEAVHVERITITSPTEGQYACVVEAVYPAIPRFRHLAKLYIGKSVSDRSVLEASLSAACASVGHILLTFQPEGYKLPTPPTVASDPNCKEISPLPSTVDSPNGCIDRGSSLFRPVFLADDASFRKGSRIARFFTCGKLD